MKDKVMAAMVGAAIGASGVLGGQALAPHEAQAGDRTDVVKSSTAKWQRYAIQIQPEGLVVFESCGQSFKSGGGVADNDCVNGPVDKGLIPGATELGNKLFGAWRAAHSLK